MIIGPEWVLVLTITMPSKKIHGRRVRPAPVTINELHRTEKSCLSRGRSMDHIIKERHTWTCHPVDPE